MVGNRNGARCSGSSPRTWGTPSRKIRLLIAIRFIPTYMGNAAETPRRNAGEPVHPHVHGERCSVSDSSFRSCGSSPRTWGTHRRISTRRVSMRFIPTYMGNASEAFKRDIVVQVHPHVHGERIDGSRLHRSHAGSSPRTWGTLSRRVPEERNDGFIPTYMGNARGALCVASGAPVHPHVHGERTDPSINAPGRPGSSPRTWGTLCSLVPGAHRVRFIPTYMGNATAPFATRRF